MHVLKIYFADRPVLSATLRQRTKEVSQIRQTRENQSNVQCPGMGRSTLSKSLPKTMSKRLPTPAIDD